MRIVEGVRNAGVVDCIEVKKNKASKTAGMLLMSDWTNPINTKKLANAIGLEHDLRFIINLSAICFIVYDFDLFREWFEYNPSPWHIVQYYLKSYGKGTVIDNT